MADADSTVPVEQRALVLAGLEDEIGRQLDELDYPALTPEAFEALHASLLSAVATLLAVRFNRPGDAPSGADSEPEPPPPTPTVFPSDFD